MPLRKKQIKRAARSGKADKAPPSILPHVVFLRANPFENKDARRFISGAAGDFGFPLQIRQIKIIEFSEDAVRDRLVVGNHRHFGESGQWELVIVLGGKKESMLRFRYRNYHSGVKEKLLKGGDIAVVPPGCSLALIALKPGVRVIEISNQEYRSENYVKDKLF